MKTDPTPSSNLWCPRGLEAHDPTLSSHNHLRAGRDGVGYLLVLSSPTGLYPWLHAMSCLIAALPLVPGTMTTAMVLQFPPAQNVQRLVFQLIVQSSSLLHSQKWSQKKILYINVHMWNLEKWHRWSYLQSRNRDTDVENKCMDTKEEGGGMNWEIGIDIYILSTVCIKQISNENLLYSTRNFTQCSVVT